MGKASGGSLGFNEIRRPARPVFFVLMGMLMRNLVMRAINTHLMRNGVSDASLKTRKCNSRFT